MVIQRSWKIPTEVAGSLNNTSTSTSNDVQQQQRSSPGLQLQAANSSSDDSDCSNQTTHSMDTRAASPGDSGVRKQPEKQDGTPEIITLSLLGESTSSEAESSQVSPGILTLFDS